MKLFLKQHRRSQVPFILELAYMILRATFDLLLLERSMLKQFYKLINYTPYWKLCKKLTLLFSAVVFGTSLGTLSNEDDNVDDDGKEQ